MRRVRYNVAASLDGYIARLDGSYDWIPADPSVDFSGLFAAVDTVLLGRHSFALTQRVGGAWPKGSRVYVFSTTLRQGDHPGVTIVRDGAAEVVSALRHEPGTGDIWLFGGGRLFSSLLADGQVDRVEVTIVPVLLGGGVPLSVPGTPEARLVLAETKQYPSGMISLNYMVHGASR